MAQGSDLIPQVNVDRKIAEKCSKVGPYIMLETIGVGSTGKVKLCVHVDTLNRYACKVVEKTYVRQQMSSIQIQREIAILSRLRHKNTVSLVSVHSTATKIFIIMELVAGGELYDEVRRLRFVGEPYARFLFRQLIDGLEYCHSHRIFHRDIKPDNLLVDVTRTLKITDFGLAALKVSDDDPESVAESLTLHTRCGTPHFASPEVIKGDASGYSGDKVDMWGCGIILYVLTAGRLPFDSPNADRMALDIIRSDVYYPPTLSESVVDLMKKLLHPNAKERYTIKDVRRHPWFSSPEPVNLNDYPPVSARAVIGRDPVIITRAREYPYPTEVDIAKRRKNRAASNNNGDSDDSTEDGRDSLDFGTRVESVSTEVPLKILKRLQELENAQNNGDTASGIPPQIEGEQAIEITTKPPPLPPRQDSLSRTLETLADERNEYHMNMDFGDTSCGPGDESVEADRDGVLWHQFMKDVDMIPNVYEFGVDSATLNELWGGGLFKEPVHRKNSFAANRFGVRPETQSPSELDPRFFMLLDAEAGSDGSTTPDEQDRVTLWSKHFRLESILSETGTKKVGYGAANQSTSLTDVVEEQRGVSLEADPESPIATVLNAPTQVRMLPEQESASIQDDPFAACLPPDIPIQAPVQEVVDTEYQPPVQEVVDTEYQPPVQEVVDAEYQPPVQEVVDTEYQPPVQEVVDTEYQPPVQEIVDTEYQAPGAIGEPEISAPQLGSGYFIGTGQDLLGEHDAVDINIGSNREILSNQGLAPIVAAESTEPTAVAGTRQGAGIPGSPSVLATTTGVGTSGGPVTPGSASESKVIHNNPFAIDVPGPRRALPVTSTILGSFVPSTISLKRFIRKRGNGDVKSFSQFHSLRDPSSCFDVVLNVLREYGCRVCSTSSSRKGKSFQIRCESKKEGVTIQTRVRIYKADDFLCTVRFKRLLGTDIEDFNRFYIDVSQLYSEAVRNESRRDTRAP